MRAALVCLVLAFCACRRAATGAVSPAGDRHPGRLVQVDEVNGRTWTDRAEDVPQSIAWARRDGRWVPVTRIVVTGAGGGREVSRYGPKGELLDRSLMTGAP